MPLVYIFYKEYKRGIIMHALGVITTFLAIAIIQIGFIVGYNTLIAIIIGTSIIFGFYAIMVYDCFLVIRKKKLTTVNLKS